MDINGWKIVNDYRWNVKTAARRVGFNQLISRCGAIMGSMEDNASTLPAIAANHKKAISVITQIREYQETVCAIAFIKSEYMIFQQALNALADPLEREVINLYYGSGKTDLAIAKQIYAHQDPQAAKVAVFRIRKKALDKLKTINVTI